MLLTSIHPFKKEYWQQDFAFEAIEKAYDLPLISSVFKGIQAGIELE